MERGAAYGDTAALVAPGRRALTYGALRDGVAANARRLADRGLRPGDPVALVGPDGPELAAAFLAVAATATCAPLDPTLRATELDFELRDLGVRCLVVTGPPGATAAAQAVAARRGVPVVSARAAADAPAGAITFDGPELAPAGAAPAYGPDVALVLHTSGTTDRPKTVPLTHRNLAASAGDVARTLVLSPDDRSLAVMPMFHVHGLVVALLASLTAGGSVVCTPGFFAPDLSSWMAECSPTWYSAVPTMHQALLERDDAFGSARLRFVRSASAALAPPTMDALERAWRAPVLEAYGLSEAPNHTCNPLPPGERKPGSVGVAQGNAVTIVGDDGSVAAVGAVGEVVVRGANVFGGYAHADEANGEAFVDLGDGGARWFRTGDLGHLDTDGYLYLTGRLKEQINRAGQTVSPREVDEALLGHPAVAQAAAFAVPDPHLGEQVAAAVVPVEGAAPSEGELRQFASLRLAPYKVPARVYVVDGLPKGKTGKVARRELAERLGTDGRDAAPEAQPRTEARDELEQVVADLWCDTLGIEPPSVFDHFLDLGGDSLLATRLLARYRDELDLDLTMLELGDAPTIAAQADLLGRCLLDAGAAS